MIRKARLTMSALLALLLLFSLSGCDFISGLFNPLLGTWQATVSESGLSGTETLVFKSDGTWTMSISISGTSSGVSVSMSMSASGTYKQDSSAETITLDGSSSGSMTVGGQTQPMQASQISGSVMRYALSDFNKTLTLTDSSSSTITAFKRQ